MHACTIAARNYLPQARVLARSFREHHPGVGFTVLVIDDPAARSRAENFALLGLDEIGLEPGEAERMALLYDVTEFATAVKPWLLRRLLSSESDVVLYFDPDIEIFAPLNDLAELARAHSIVLTPHVLEPLPQDGLEPSESTIMGAGIYNLGFIGVGPRSERFLDWWAARLRRDCLIDPPNMRFTDQRWIDFVPALFEHHLLRDPACNVAYWNLAQRKLSWNGNGYEVDGRPLRFFHYSGYDPDHPSRLSKFQSDPPRVRLEAEPALARICAGYREQLTAEGFDEGKHEQYGYVSFGAGLPIDAAIRTLYRSALLKHETGDGPEPPNPFFAADAGAFLEWLNEPVESASAVITRYMLAIHGAREDLRRLFPDPLGHDAPALYEWCVARRSDQPEAYALLIPALNRAEAAKVASARFRRGDHRRDVIGERIHFRSGGNSEPYRLAGWGRSEAEFTWSIGDYAQLALPVAERIRPLEFEITMGAFTSAPTLGSQRVEVSADSGKIAAWTVAKPALFRALIPAEAAKSGLLLLEFRTPDAVAPRDVLPNNDDPRRLGISVANLCLAPASALRRSLRALGR